VAEVEVQVAVEVAAEVEVAVEVVAPHLHPYKSWLKWSSITIISRRSGPRDHQMGAAEAEEEEAGAEVGAGAAVVSNGDQYGL
jgi:hypothetical protein